MEDKKYHFWFSQKQKECCQEIDLNQGKRPQSLFAKTEQGKIVEYTEMGRAFSMAGNWDDYIYLGRGWYDSSR